MTSSQSGQDPVLPDLAAIQELLRTGKTADALSSCETALETHPTDPELQYTRAVCLRYLGRFEDALTTLGELREKHPAHSRAQQELGHVFLALGNQTAALTAFQQAGRLNGALVSSFERQAALLQHSGRSGEAAQVLAHVQHLKSLPGPLLAAMDLAAQGKLVKAETLCRKILHKNPRHIETMRLLADVGVRLGILEDAEYLLESAVALAPEHAGARIDYIQVLRKAQKYRQALSEAEALLAQSPENPQYRSLVAIERWGSAISMKPGSTVRARRILSTRCPTTFVTSG